MYRACTQVNKGPARRRTPMATIAPAAFIPGMQMNYAFRSRYCCANTMLKKTKLDFPKKTHKSTISPRNYYTALVFFWQSTPQRPRCSWKRIPRPCPQGMTETRSLRSSFGYCTIYSLASCFLLRVPCVLSVLSRPLP